MNRWVKKRIYHAKASARGGKRADLDGMFFRSRWEANVARCLNAMKASGDIVSWAYEVKEFEFPVKRGTRFYKPDFEVVLREGDAPIYWEVKGLMMQKDVTSLTRMQRYYPEITVLIVDKKRYDEFQSEYGNLPGWER